MQLSRCSLQSCAAQKEICYAVLLLVPASFTYYPLKPYGREGGGFVIMPASMANTRTCTIHVILAGIHHVGVGGCGARVCVTSIRVAILALVILD